MSSAMPLRFVVHTTDPVLLICEGSTMPAVGQRVRAVGSEGNGLLVLAIVERDQLPDGANRGEHAFGMKLKYNEIPWAPNTPIEIVLADGFRQRSDG